LYILTVENLSQKTDDVETYPQKLMIPTKKFSYLTSFIDFVIILPQSPKTSPLASKDKQIFSLF